MDVLLNLVSFQGRHSYIFTGYTEVLPHALPVLPTLARLGNEHRRFSTAFPTIFEVRNCSTDSKCTSDSWYRNM